jgi:hypothetical protein
MNLLAPFSSAGFIYLPSFAHSYAVTQSASDLRQALAAAEALAWNWNPATKSLRTFEGWEPVQASKAYKQIVIIGEQAAASIQLHC